MILVLPMIAAAMSLQCKRQMSESATREAVFAAERDQKGNGSCWVYGTVRALNSSRSNFRYFESKNIDVDNIRTADQIRNLYNEISSETFESDRRSFISRDQSQYLSVTKYTALAYLDRYRRWRVDKATVMDGGNTAEINRVLGAADLHGPLFESEYRFPIQLPKGLDPTSFTDVLTKHIDKLGSPTSQKAMINALIVDHTKLPNQFRASLTISDRLLLPTLGRRLPQDPIVTWYTSGSGNDFFVNLDELNRDLIVEWIAIWTSLGFSGTLSLEPAWDIKHGDIRSRDELIQSGLLQPKTRIREPHMVALKGIRSGHSLGYRLTYGLKNSDRLQSDLTLDTESDLHSSIGLPKSVWRRFIQIHEAAKRQSNCQTFKRLPFAGAAYTALIHLIHSGVFRDVTQPQLAEKGVPNLTAPTQDWLAQARKCFRLDEEALRPREENWIAISCDVELNLSCKKPMVNYCSIDKSGYNFCVNPTEMGSDLRECRHVDTLKECTSPKVNACLLEPRPLNQSLCVVPLRDL